MLTENLETAEDFDPKNRNRTDEDVPKMATPSTDDDDDNEDDDDDNDGEAEDDDDGDYTILPSNDSGITADDNAATGRMHEKEGE